MESSTNIPIIHRTYQRRGYLSKDGYNRLDGAMSECALLYNAALQERRDAWRMLGERVYYKHQQAQLKDIRADLPEWGDLDTLIARGVLRRIERAFNGFFRRIDAGQTPGYPRFKNRNRWHTIDLAGVRPGMVKDGKVRIKGLPAIHIKQGGLPDSSQLKALRITRKGRRVTVNLTYGELAPLLPTNGDAVGIDLGITDRLAMSDGTLIARRESDREGMVKKERRLSRCKRGSRERRKRARILANGHHKRHIRNRNECHRITTSIVREYGHIAVEGLQITNMVKSAKGTVEAPGKNVRAKSGLNRGIKEQTWGMLRDQLRYKAEWAGREYVVVPARNTSQRCSNCGIIDFANRKGKAYHCLQCGYKDDADVNAATNIKARAFGGWEFPAAVPDAA